MRVALVIAAALLVAGCGGRGPSVSHGAAREHGRCTSASGGFRACTVFGAAGERSRIERRQGSAWSVLLPAARAPFAGHGWWRRVVAAPGEETLLAEWSGECELPFAYLVSTGSGSSRRVFRSSPATVVGWAPDGTARVRLLQPVYATRTRIRLRSGIYRVEPAGPAVRLERPVAPARGC